MSKSIKDLLFGIKVNKVDGMFICTYNKLTSLEGSPKHVEKEFDVGSNELINLIGSPEDVGSFSAYGNKLTSLKGCPKIIKRTEHGGGLTVSNNKLTSLEGCPETIPSVFFFNSNPITSLEHFPKYCGLHVHIPWNKALKKQFKTQINVRSWIKKKGIIIKGEIRFITPGRYDEE